MTKPTKWHVRTAKTQISLGLCPVWSESSLSAWRNLGSLATHWAHSQDSDQPEHLSLCWAHSHFLGFVLWRLICPDRVTVMDSDPNVCYYNQCLKSKYLNLTAFAKSNNCHANIWYSELIKIYVFLYLKKLEFKSPDSSNFQIICCLNRHWKL